MVVDYIHAEPNEKGVLDWNRSCSDSEHIVIFVIMATREDYAARHYCDGTLEVRPHDDCIYDSFERILNDSEDGNFQFEPLLVRYAIDDTIELLPIGVHRISVKIKSIMGDDGDHVYRIADGVKTKTLWVF